MDEEDVLILPRLSRLSDREASLARASFRDRELGGETRIGAHDEGVERKPAARRRREMEEVGRMLNNRSSGSSGMENSKESVGFGVCGRNKKSSSRGAC